MLVIEAAMLLTVDKWLVFQSADGQPLATLPVAEVLSLETVNTHLVAGGTTASRARA